MGNDGSELFPIAKEALDAVIRAQAKNLVSVPDLDPFLFLKAIAVKETSYGANNRPRFEFAYSPQGSYGLRSASLQQLIETYGRSASCSWGPWQILAITAFDCGYRGDPKLLRDPAVSIPYVIRFLNHWIYEGADTLEDLADSWNSGSYKDANVPAAYIADIKKIYTNLTLPLTPSILV